VEEMEVEAAADVIEEVEVTAAADIIVTVSVEAAADVFEDMEETSAASIVEAAVDGGQTSGVSDVMLEMEEEATATVLLEVEPESGADVVESMATADLTGAAERVEAAVQLRLEEVDADVAAEIMEKAVTILEAVTVESLVDLFLTIANLPDTPSTVADVFAVMDITKVLEVISYWVSTGELEDLGMIFEYLPADDLHRIWWTMVASEREVVFASLSAETLAILPSLARFEVSDQMVSPLEVRLGQSVTVSMTVSNVGYESGEYGVEVKLDDVVVDSALVMLDAGGSTSVSFTVSSGEVGGHTVLIEGLTAGFYVQPRVFLWPVVFGVVLAVAIGIWYLYRTRKAPESLMRLIDSLWAKISEVIRGSTQQ